MNVSNLRLDERFLRSFLEDQVELWDVSNNADKNELNCWFTLLQLINTYPDNMDTAKVLKSLKEDAVRIPSQLGLLDGDIRSSEWKQDLGPESPREIVRFLPEEVLAATSVLSRDKIAMITTVLRFLLIMLGATKNES